MPSPLAVWVTDSRSMSMDRSSINRGWASSYKRGYIRPTIPDGWDFPCVLGFDLPLSVCGTHDKPFKNGRRCRRYLTGRRREVPLAELHLVEVSFHRPTYERFQEIGTHWHELEAGTKVMCRCREKHPDDFYKGGHGDPLSCARVSTNPLADGPEEATVAIGLTNTVGKAPP